MLTYSLVKSIYVDCKCLLLEKLHRTVMYLRWARKLKSKAAVHRLVFRRTYPREEPCRLVHSFVDIGKTKTLGKFHPLSLFSIRLF